MLARRYRGGTKRDSARPDSGAVAVEFALILPLLAMLLLGIVTFGLAYSDHLALTNTVREGARFGATTPNGSNWGTDVQTRTQNLYGNADNPLPPANICALLMRKTATSANVVQSSSAGCQAGSTAAGDPPDTPADIPTDACFVKVWARLPAHLNWAVVDTNITLHAESVAAYDRTLLCT